MADFLTASQRSALMSRVRSRGNFSTELRLITLLRRERILGWRRGYPLPGRPDFVFLRLRVALFVDGCFWHGCPRHSRTPVTNSDFWREKIERNITRDRKVNNELRKRGWKIVRVWHHELKRKDERRLLAKLARALKNDSGGTASGAS